MPASASKSGSKATTKDDQLQQNFVTIAEAARQLALSRNSVNRRIAAGHLAGYQDPESSYRYVSRASVEEALRRRRILQESALIRLPSIRRPKR